jgi:hypothetical protein
MCDPQPSAYSLAIGTEKVQRLDGGGFQNGRLHSGNLNVINYPECDGLVFGA